MKLNWIISATPWISYPVYSCLVVSVTSTFTAYMPSFGELSVKHIILKEFVNGYYIGKTTIKNLQMAISIQKGYIH